MPEELSPVEESMNEVLIDLMNERVMSKRVMYEGIQVSSTRGVKASLSIARGSGPSRPTMEKRTKKRDDLANAKLIPTILPEYISPLAGVVSRDSVPEIF
jgi:hypothetical protein